MKLIIIFSSLTLFLIGSSAEPIDEIYIRDRKADSDFMGDEETNDDVESFDTALKANFDYDEGLKSRSNKYDDNEDFNLNEIHDRMADDEPVYRSSNNRNQDSKYPMTMSRMRSSMNDEGVAALDNKDDNGAKESKEHSETKLHGRSKSSHSESKKHSDENTCSALGSCLNRCLSENENDGHEKHDENPYGNMALQDDNMEDWFNDYDTNDWAVDSDYANSLDEIYGDFEI